MDTQETYWPITILLNCVTYNDMRVSCILCGVVLSMILLVPVSIHAQTYDTPSTLVVQMASPTYQYTDVNGYTIVTGMIYNESELSYVGNVVLLVKFYDDTSNTPLYRVISSPSLQVIPPKSSSPFSVQSPEPGIRIADVIPSILTFEQANPKPLGLHIDMDHITGNVTVSDVAHAPHTNVTIHVAYRDVFEPPRVLRTDTYVLGDMEMDGTLFTNVYGNIPYNARSVAIYAESDVFSSVSIQKRIFNVASPPNLASYITDVWIKDDNDTRIVLLDAYQNVTLGTGLHLDANNTHWLYLQIKPKVGSAIVFSESMQVQLPITDISVPWSPSYVGDYIMEVFLRNNLNTPISVPGPIVLFTVE